MYQWYYKLAGSSSFVKWSGRTTSGFSFTAGSAKSGMQVYCEVTDASGQMVRSNTITMTVGGKLTITQQPVDILAADGESIRFSLKAQGQDLTYQWYYKMPGSSSFVKWTGRTTSGFSFTAAASKSGMQLYCEVTDASGEMVRSNTITMTVKAKLAITRQPADVTVIDGESTRFSLQANGTGLTYQWYYKLPGTSGFVKWSGRTTAAFTFTCAYNKNGMELYCVVTDSDGNSVQSNTITLSVL